MSHESDSARRGSAEEAAPGVERVGVGEDDDQPADDQRGDERQHGHDADCRPASAAIAAGPAPTPRSVRRRRRPTGRRRVATSVAVVT